MRCAFLFIILFTVSIPAYAGELYETEDYLNDTLGGNPYTSDGGNGGFPTAPTSSDAGNGTSPNTPTDSNDQLGGGGGNSDGSVNSVRYRQAQAVINTAMAAIAGAAGTVRRGRRKRDKKNERGRSGDSFIESVWSKVFCRSKVFTSSGKQTRYSRLTHEASAGKILQACFTRLTKSENLQIAARKVRKAVFINTARRSQIWNVSPLWFGDGTTDDDAVISRPCVVCACEA
jgi:hypothetical protein